MKAKAKTKRKRRKRKPKTHDPEVKVRKKLIVNPQVLQVNDFTSKGLVRVLHRKTDSFPEFALYPEHTRSQFNKNIVLGSLKDAGFTDEGKGKWVLRTNKFNVFVYV